MMHVKLFIHPARVLAPCCLLALAACANPALNNQLANSREAVDQAKIVGAVYEIETGRVRFLPSE